MKIRLISYLAIGALFFAITACEQGAKTESTAEQAEKAVEQTGQAMEKAVESATDAAKDAMGTATDSAEKAADGAQKQN